MHRAQSPSMRRFDDDVEDLRQYAGHSSTAPMFHDSEDQNGVVFSSNAHPEMEYEDVRRMPDQLTYVDQLDENGRYVGMKRILTDPPMSLRVKNQVLDSIGSRAGTMTSRSLLDRSRGVGEYGDDGGIGSRAQVRPSDLLSPAEKRKLDPTRGRY